MIVIVIDSMERYYFVKRLVRAVRSEFRFLFLTSEPVAHLGLKAMGYKSIYLNRNTPYRAAFDGLADTTPYDSAIEVLNGQISVERAKLDSAAVFGMVSAIFRRHKVSRCLMWNGQQLICRTISHVCAIFGVPTRFVELSNLPDKLFVDSMGVNALSSISREPALIDRLPMPSEDDHKKWLRQYEQYKLRPLPQSQTSYKRKFVSAINYGLKFSTRGVGRKAIDTVKATNGATVPREAKALTADDLAYRQFVFLPLQVSGDTQIKLHSDVGNIEAIQIAFEYASNASSELIVKIHPAENDTSVIEEIVRLREVYHFDIATSPTVELIKYADSVVTINSTVGLEALLYGKKVVSLGRCFYKEFDRNRLMKYIHGFLVDGIDYFGAGDIPAKAARKVLAVQS
ncbi:capsular biosynthesis protein [Paraburkholderia sp.]|uniref:capsular polysaccharide export protein, LipB/KpsS family n=1 Tax=Paraburkholderia sp. TaxID=1926495 RepID=UPI0023962027|nr:capsular biosynthesis protein [Paraburkholderia sp.]MDE1180423.1 capsular biosynthesis protein [Paraburkholderia sp.]